MGSTSGRSELIDSVGVAIERVGNGLQAKSQLLIGLRGVGKTVLLDHLRVNAEDAGVETLRIEASEKKSLPSLLAPQLRQALLRLSRNEKAKDLAQRALRGSAGFAKALKVKYGDIEVGLDLEPEAGLADNGDLEHDLQALLEAAGAAAASGDKVLAIFIDELQYVPEHELAALIVALHRCAQRKRPVLLVGAGLPQLRGRMGEAKSYAERLFEFPEIGPLKEEDAKAAIALPVKEQGAAIEPGALDRIHAETKGYPYFVQEWGKHSWDAAPGSPIREVDVHTATMTAVAALDGSFFGVRFDRLTPAEKNYLRAMAELGPGPHRSGDIAEVLKVRVTALGPRRSSLINKGMIWSPNHGDTAFTVPLFDQFMKRMMPGDEWRKT
jgi:hypothetical protein